MISIKYVKDERKALWGLNVFLNDSKQPYENKIY